MSHFEQVHEFHSVFGLDISTEPYTTVCKENHPLVKLRFDLIREEVLELYQAFQDHNVLEVIDALTDILYVVYGAGVSFGINMDTEFRRLPQIKSSVLTSSAKLSNFQLTRTFYEQHSQWIPNVIMTVFEAGNESVVECMKENMVNAMNLISIAFAEDDFSKIQSSLLNMLYITYLIGAKLGVNLDDSFRIVHESNMSKVCLTETAAKETVKWYKQQDNSPYDSPLYRLSQDEKYYVIFNQSSGKILKSIYYTPADFRSLLPNVSKSTDEDIQ